ncbi:MAG: magnesium-translocating P-type ATPase [Flavisolibacter sp.]
METSGLLLKTTSEKAMARWHASTAGLSAAEAQRKLTVQRKQRNVQKTWLADALLLLQQFKSPLVLLLVFALVLSAVLGQYSDSLIVLAVLLITGILGFMQERNAGKAVQALQALVHSKARVRRDGKEQEIYIDDVVEGDAVFLRAGDIIPADAIVIEANDLHVNEAVLTGESFPVEKFAAASAATEGTNVSHIVFKGTSVINGTAIIIVVETGAHTELGKISWAVQKATTITSFEQGITAFGKLLVSLTVIFSAAILLFNLLFHRPFFESLLFSLALAVGIAPELLPAILSITLAAGARRMAKQNVIVKKLSAIQNLGAIDVLCSDKTGTVTDGLVQLHKGVNAADEEDKNLLRYAYLNAYFETGFANPIDEAIRRQKEIDITGYTKCDEVPYDFLRKRLSVVVEKNGRHLMITKGSFKTVTEVCKNAQLNENEVVPLDKINEAVKRQFETYSDEGFRAIAIACRDVTGDPVINKDDETDMTYLGLLLFSDPLKEGVLQSIQTLKQKGVSLKIITGDNYRVAQYIAAQLALSPQKILLGSDVAQMDFATLVQKANETELFAEILPVQKETIIKAFQKCGHTVGYLGDGINDAPALKSADVGISVQGAVDVAKEAADLVLLDRHLDVISRGIDEGRRTFTNTMKYIFVTTSANFGNMFSMAIASLLLPFMPLLPVQILLNNFLSDLPAFGIASDKVDKELIAAPQQWNIRSIKRFMVVFGLQSSVFDFALFALLYFVFAASPEEFRTAWFTESLMTEIFILLVIRTRRSFFKSSPSKYLLLATTLTFGLCVSLPYLPFAPLFELYPMPLSLLGSILLITALYIFLAEQTKKWLFKRL